ncbi:hypothetical protein [Rhizobium sp. UGM030330-04]|uniref:hypothetical protein n=1 Tax=Pseudomonadota TaxID=1224 RepID=UPI000BD5FB4B|nr:MULTISPECIES: hypothetical protein [Pseudomonadota]PYG53227.1 hypothetical protein N434_04948 [Rhizobium sp. UGM030330-04]SNY78307.1 hypothetical protein SAMN02744784_04275 [Stenotrophomonas sp. CC120223-11]
MRNYRTKIACATGALTLAMAMPMLADSDHQVTRQMLSETDRAAIFGKDSNFQVALLTEAEMAETKGALWPFIGNWVARSFIGGFFGAISWGWDTYNRPYGGIPPSLGHHVLLYSLAGLLSSSTTVGGAVGLVVDKAGGVDVIDATAAAIRTKMIEAEWTIRDLLDRVGTAIDEVVADHLQDSSGGGRAESASVEFADSTDSSSRYLINLIDTLDRTSLRQFFSSLPESTLRLNLAQVGIQTETTTSREDFLANLPTDTVNRVLLGLSDDLMSQFLEDVVPQTLQDSITAAGNTPSDSTTAKDVHWIY